MTPETDPRLPGGRVDVWIDGQVPGTRDPDGTLGLCVGTELRLLYEVNGAWVTEDQMDLRRAFAARVTRAPQD